MIRLRSKLMAYISAAKIFITVLLIAHREYAFIGHSQVAEQTVLIMIHRDCRQMKPRFAVACCAGLVQ